MANINQQSFRRVKNLEIYSVAILSRDLDASHKFQIELKKLIDYITIFDTQDDVKNYIIQNEHDRIILLVSLELGESVIKYTHDLQQLYQIYVYNPANDLSQWTNGYKKVSI